MKAIVEKLRSKLPSTKVLVLAIFPRGPDKDDTKRKVNEGANEIIKHLADNKMVYYLDIGPKFLAADGTLSKDVMPDLLHLNETELSHLGRSDRAQGERVDGREVGATLRVPSSQRGRASRSFRPRRSLGRRIAYATGSQIC